MLFHLKKDKKWKTINMEFVSYFLLILSKKIKRRIGYFYPNITLKNSFKTKKKETLALKYYIPTNKFYTIFTFFHIRPKQKNCKVENFLLVHHLLKLTLSKKVGINCAIFF